MKYNPKKIEAKWQAAWQVGKVFAAKEKKNSQGKFYPLVEFPYPSGDGLHTGHLRSYTAMDVIARKKRMEGYSVLYPMGFDSFGLPTENYAIKNKIAPQKATAKNIANFTRQLKSLGYSFDWQRAFSTSDAEYYKWTQWIFIQMFKKGLAYKAKENINWCTSCKIGLANEEVVAGVCERCGGEVIKKEKEQWLLKITKYADRLIKDLDLVDFLPQIKKQQIDWISKSQGAEIDFSVVGFGEKIKIFTTRPDTIFGATFMVLAPEHELINSLAKDISNFQEVEKYIRQAKGKSDLERTENKDKSGVEIKGIKVLNPASGEEIPIFVADYVLSTYGFGAIMAVPAHDQRDYDFAKKYNLPIREVIQGGDISKEAYSGDGLAINSEQYNGLSSEEFKKKITTWLEKNNLGKKAVNYKLRDWIFSRQRYWGEPIPMINCSDCGWVPEAEKNLPVVLPPIKDYLPTDQGDSPLAKAKSWVKTSCPQCGSLAQRETDVMPNWAGSNWYFIRYADPKNNKKLIDRAKAKYWLPVDWYNGGMEHTTLHLLYSRFVFKFLYDIGLVPKTVGSEPYKKRTAQGMILGEGGIKMSKSKGNVINPDFYVKQYGADTVRVYEMFMGPFDQSIAWDDKGVSGVYRFLNKVWAITKKASSKSKASVELSRLAQQSIKKVGEDIDSMKFNTAVSQLMIFANALDKEKSVPADLMEKFALILSPFAPHIAEEIWQQLGSKKFLANFQWPEYDRRLIQEDLVKIGIQINGKVRDEISLPFDALPSPEIEQQVLALAKVKKHIADKKIIKFIHIKNKIISIVIK
ncbi:MAG: leucine--tRNA ligase [Patescibacteria group bacterium]|nr:leucine--tRNA ligase [Patescibacteria group bacterium]